jgi:hypothetical protein
MTLTLDSINWRRAPDLGSMGRAEADSILPEGGMHLVEDQGVCTVALDEGSFRLCWRNWITKAEQEIQENDLYMPIRPEWLEGNGHSPRYLVYSPDDVSTMPEQGELCLVLEHGLRRCVRMYDMSASEAWADTPAVGIGWTADLDGDGDPFPDKYENGRCWIPVDYIRRDRGRDDGPAAREARLKLRASDWARLDFDDKATWPRDGDACIVKRAGVRRFGHDSGRLYWDSLENGHIDRWEDTEAWDEDEYIVINYEDGGGS